MPSFILCNNRNLFPSSFIISSPSIYFSLTYLKAVSEIIICPPPVAHPSAPSALNRAGPIVKYSDLLKRPPTYKSAHFPKPIPILTLKLVTLLVIFLLFNSF